MLTNGQITRIIEEHGPCDESLEWLDSLDPDGNPLEALENCPEPGWIIWLADEVRHCKTVPHWETYQEAIKPVLMALTTGEYNWEAYQVAIKSHWNVLATACKPIVIEWINTLE